MYLLKGNNRKTEVMKSAQLIDTKTTSNDVAMLSSLVTLNRFQTLAL